MQLNPEVQPKVLLPQYQIPAAILAVTEDVGVDAASEEHDEPEVKVKAIQRTYERAMDTIKRSQIYAWRNDPERAEAGEKMRIF